MPHVTDSWRGLPRMRIHGEIPVEDSRQRFREMIGLIRAGRLHLLLVYAEDTTFPASAMENLLLQKAIGEFLAGLEGGALALACGNEVAYGTARQFQRMAANRKVSIGVFREEEEAAAWLLSSLAETASPQT